MRLLFLKYSSFFVLALYIRYQLRSPPAKYLCKKNIYIFTYIRIEFKKLSKPKKFDFFFLIHRMALYVKLYIYWSLTGHLIWRQAAPLSVTWLQSPRLQSPSHTPSVNSVVLIRWNHSFGLRVRPSPYHPP